MAMANRLASQVPIEFVVGKLMLKISLRRGSKWCVLSSYSCSPFANRGSPRLRSNRFHCLKHPGHSEELLLAR